MVSIRGLIGAGIPVIAIIFMLISLFSVNWYTFEEDAYITTMEFKYGLSKAEVWGRTYDYEDENDSKAYDAADNTKILMLIGLVSLILFIVIGVISSIGFLDRLGKFVGFIPLIVGILAGLAIIIATIVFAVSFPSGLEDDIGEDPGGSLGFAWYFALMAGIITLIGAGLTARIPKKKIEPISKIDTSIFDESS